MTCSCTSLQRAPRTMRSASVMHGGGIMASREHGPSGVPWRLIGWGGAVAPTGASCCNFPGRCPTSSSPARCSESLARTFELAVGRGGNGWYRGEVAMAGNRLPPRLDRESGAVGIIGDEDNPANLMFMVIILMAVAGAIAALSRGCGHGAGHVRRGRSRDALRRSRWQTGSARRNRRAFGRADLDRGVRWDVGPVEHSSGEPR